jgi:Arm domain-containing DNA-binding protein
MPRAKSLPAKRRKKIGSWGGRRDGAGRKRALAIEVREKITKDYFARRRSDSALSGKPLRRETVIRKLMAKFGVTHRMVERALGEFLPQIREGAADAALFAYAMDGTGKIRELPKRIGRLRPGEYSDGEDLRLVVDSRGNRKWVFRFIWKDTVGDLRHTVRDMVHDRSNVSLAEARQWAAEARKMLKAGQNPIRAQGGKSKS